MGIEEVLEVGVGYHHVNQYGQIHLEFARIGCRHIQVRNIEADGRTYFPRETLHPWSRRSLERRRLRLRQLRLRKWLSLRLRLHRLRLCWPRR